jgi:GntR family transcriptional regulator of arabinose operon
MCRHINLYEMLDSYQIPYVFIQGSYAKMKHKPHILMDDCRGGYLVTEHLIARGRRALIGMFKADDTQGQQRHKGYVQALQAAGIPYDPDKVVWFYTEDRKSHPYEKMKQLIDERHNLYFDGVICYNDQIALQVLRAMEEKGVDCPGEIAVTGYDDSYLASTCRVPLTTVTHPQERLGQMAAELLLRLIREGDQADQTQILIQPELVVRKSSG